MENYDDQGSRPTKSASFTPLQVQLLLSRNTSLEGLLSTPNGILRGGGIVETCYGRAGKMEVIVQELNIVYQPNACKENPANSNFREIWFYSRPKIFPDCHMMH